VLARTNSQGLALLPRLAAHQLNRVRLDANELPPEAEPETIELPAVPPWRAGVKLRFAVREGRAARLAFMVAEGLPAPRGAVVQLHGDTREFMVGGRGEAYVTGLPPGVGQAVTLSWRGRTCEVQVSWAPPAPEAAEPPTLPRLGPFSCPGIEP
jgi:outer membrane usher protein